jgi:excisionase family DNA binding protein
MPMKDPPESYADPSPLQIQDQPVLLTAEEVALRLNVSERTLWRLLSAGKLPKPVRFGRNTRWKAAELAEWIQLGCPVDR